MPREYILLSKNEKIPISRVMAYPFQTESRISDWHYKEELKYLNSKKVVELLMENVSRNGAMLLNLTQHGCGHLDPELIWIAKDIGSWLRVNGEAVYGSRPFERCSEDSLRSHVTMDMFMLLI